MDPSHEIDAVGSTEIQERRPSRLGKGIGMTTQGAYFCHLQSVAILEFLDQSTKPCALKLQFACDVGKIVQVKSCQTNSILPKVMYFLSRRNATSQTPSRPYHNLKGSAWSGRRESNPRQLLGKQPVISALRELHEQYGLFYWVYRALSGCFLRSHCSHNPSSSRNY